MPGDQMNVEPGGASNNELRNIGGKAAVVDKVSKRPFFTFPTVTVSISAVWVSLDKTMVASGYEDGTVRIWRTDLPKVPLVTLHAHTTAVKVIDSPLSESKLLSADADGNIQIWPLYSVPQLVEAANGRYGGDHPKDR